MITDRDKGLYDNMSLLYKKFGLPNAKKQIFESLKVNKNNKEISP